MLPWGSSKVNILGYASHCPFAPFSTGILLGLSAFGVFLVNKFELRTVTGYGIFTLGCAGLTLGMVSSGLGFAMLFLGLVGIILGMVFTFLVGLHWNSTLVPKGIES